MIFIDDKEVCFSESLIIPKDQEAVITTVIDGWELTLSFFFTDSSEDKSSITWKPISSNNLRMELVNWNNPLGTSLIPLFS